MEPYYNLIDEEWIPCLMLDGRIEKYGIREAFDMASEIKEICSSSPLTVTAIQRLFLAILYDAFVRDAKDFDNDWFDLYDLKKFDINAKLGSYLDACHDDFFLFGDKPFYQDKSLDDVSVKEYENSPCGVLARGRESGNNPLLEGLSDSDPLTLDVAACYLITAQCYSISSSAGGRGGRAVLAKGYTVMLSGKNLFESLMLNLFKPDGFQENQKNPDSPAWKQYPKYAFSKDAIPNGYIHYLTWQSLRVLLVLEDDKSTVKWCKHDEHDVSLDKNTVFDPFKCYSIKEKEDEVTGLREKVHVPLGFKREKALWRDVHVLLEDSSQIDPKKQVRHPGIFKRVAELKGYGCLDHEYTIIASGYAHLEGVIMDCTPIAFWSQERLPIPESLFSKNGQNSILPILRQYLDYSERVFESLKKSVGGFSKLMKCSKRTYLVSELLYWSYLGAPFIRIMIELSKDSSKDGEFRQKWYETVRLAKSKTIDNITKLLGNDGNVLECWAKSEGKFLSSFKRLSKIFLPPEKVVDEKIDALAE